MEEIRSDDYLADYHPGTDQEIVSLITYYHTPKPQTGERKSSEAEIDLSDE